MWTFRLWKFYQVQNNFRISGNWKFRSNTVWLGISFFSFSFIGAFFVPFFVVREDIPVIMFSPVVIYRSNFLVRFYLISWLQIFVTMSVWAVSIVLLSVIQELCLWDERSGIGNAWPRLFFMKWVKNGVLELGGFEMCCLKASLGKVKWVKLYFGLLVLDTSF